MVGKKVIIFFGVLLSAMLIGCGAPEEIGKEEITKTPTTSLSEVTESTKPVQEEFPYELQSTFSKETDEGKDGEYVYFRSSIEYPVFEGKYADNMNRFVTSLVDEFRESLPEAKENAEYDYEESKKNEYGMQIFPEEEELIVSCVWAKEQITVLKEEYYSNTGGVHPNIFCKAYVVDMTDGYKETFEEMIRPYGLTTDEVVAFATERIQAEHGEELFPTDDEDFLEDWVYLFTQMHQWYFNEKGLVLFANPYEVAAYAYGMIECEISYEELEQGLKK